MSRDAVVAFLKKVAEDPELQDELATFARERGFDFSSSELADADLDRIVGGVTAIRGEATDKDHESWTDILE